MYYNEGFPNLPGTPIVCITSYSKGLVIGSDKGDFGLWLKDEDPAKLFDRKPGDNEKFEMVYLAGWSSERKRRSDVVAMDITPNDEVLAVAFGDNDIATFPLGKIIPQINEGL